MSRVWRRLSLRSQLTLGLLACMLLLGAAITLALFLYFERFQQHLTEQGLRERSERLLTAMVLRNGEPELAIKRIDPAYQRPLSGDYFVIRMNGREWRSRSLWDYEMLQHQPPANGRLQRLPGPVGQRLLLQSEVYERFGQRVVITVASDYAPLRVEFQRALWQFTGLWLGVLMLALLGMQVYVRLALAPLQRARSELQAVREGRQTGLSEAVPAELEPLISQINDLLEHTRGSLQRSRTALGNFGHALKTPLAVLANLVARSELDEHPVLQAQLREQVDSIAGRVQRELAQAQSAADSHAFEPFLPEQDLQQLAAALEKAHGRALQVRWEVAGVDVVGLDRSDLLEIYGNALDNAWKWARSTVLVRIAPRTDHWLLEVEDDGPGIADVADRQKALLRGARLDESVAGQGLGLAIVADIVQAYSGQVSLHRSALGGLKVSVTLPRRMAAAPH